MNNLNYLNLFGILFIIPIISCTNNTQREYYDSGELRLEYTRLNDSTSFTNRGYYTIIAHNQNGDSISLIPNGICKEYYKDGQLMWSGYCTDGYPVMPPKNEMDEWKFQPVRIQSDIPFDSVLIGDTINFWIHNAKIHPKWYMVILYSTDYNRNYIKLDEDGDYSYSITVSEENVFYYTGSGVPYLLLGLVFTNKEGYYITNNESLFEISLNICNFKNIPDGPPEFPGGSDALKEYLSENIIYPQEDFIKKIEGTVVCEFDISPTGNIHNVNIIKSVSKSIDNEAIRVISEMPRWKPGIQNRKAVNVHYKLPLKFSLK